MENIMLNNTTFTTSSNSTASDEATLTALQSILVGVSYLIVTTLYVIPYVLCLFIMHTDKTMATSNLYRIIIHMGYSDVIQLLFNGVPAGVYSILRNDRPIYLNKVLGAIVDGAWFAYIGLSQLLAINRFVHIFASHQIPYIFSNRSTKVFVGLCWLFVNEDSISTSFNMHRIASHGETLYLIKIVQIYFYQPQMNTDHLTVNFFKGLSFVIALCVPNIDFYYSVKISSYLYGSSPASLIVVDMNLYIDIAHSIGLIGWYSLIYLKVHWKMKSINMVVDTNDDDKDRKLLLQAFLLCFSDVVTVVSYMVLQHFPSIGSFLPVLINYTWILCAGNNVVVYLALNDTIKKRIKLIITQRQFHEVSTSSGGGGLLTASHHGAKVAPSNQHVKH